MNYLTTSEFESKLIPGMKFKLRKMSHKRRMEYNRMGAAVFAKLNDLERQLDPIQEEIDRAEQEAKIAPCTCQHGEKLEADASGTRDITHDPKTGRCLTPGCACRQPQPVDDAYRQRAELNLKHVQIYTDELVPMRIRWGVQSIEGLEIDGKPATVEQFLEEMPEEILGEISIEIERQMKISLDEQLGFKSPTTGSAAEVVGEKIPNSSADTAETIDSSTRSAVPA